eukprot:2063436-Amphidinium_carterae.1
MQADGELFDTRATSATADAPMEDTTNPQMMGAMNMCVRDLYSGATADAPTEDTTTPQLMGAMNMCVNEEPLPNFGEMVVRELYSESEFTDEITGLPLPKDGVLAARADELNDYARYDVFEEVDEEMAWTLTGKAPVGSRWKDINKGDAEHVQVRSRLIATWVARRGSHYIGGGTSTQQVIACSSGEAEYYAGLKGASEGLGIGAIAKELGMSLSLHLETDSSASYGTCKRRGHGKLKHMEIKYLWLQQAVYAGRLSIQKIPRSENRSDLFTKACDIKDLEEHLKGLNMTRTNMPTEAKGMKVGVNLEAMIECIQSVQTYGNAGSGRPTGCLCKRSGNHNGTG